MKHVYKKQIIVVLFVFFILSIITITIFWYQFKQKNEPVVEVSNQNTITVSETDEKNAFTLEDPIVEMKNDEFEFLSGGYEDYEKINENSQSRILVYLTLDSNEPVYYTQDWQLDSYDVSTNKEMVIYGTFHTQARIYRIYRYDVSSGTNVLLKEFDISDSAIFTIDHLHLPLSSLELSPDAEHYYLRSYRFDHKNYIGLEYHNFVQATDGGDLVELTISENIYQQYWFSNSEIAFSGAVFAGSGYEESYVQIYNIYTHQIFPTQIPSRGAFSGLSPKINEAATAYAYYDITENHGYACGGSIINLIVLSYPDGNELFKLENLHEVEYRWLINGALEIKYTRIPEVDGEYLPRSKTDQETLDSIQCSKEETMYFEGP